MAESKFTNNKISSTNKIATMETNLSLDYQKTTTTGRTRYVNLTCPTDLKEVITVDSADIKTVTSSVKNLYPNKVSDGVSFTVKVEELATKTDPQLGRVDLPYICSIQFRGSQDGDLTDALYEQALQRCLDVLYHNGTWNIKSLMLGGTDISANETPYVAG